MSLEARSVTVGYGERVVLDQVSLGIEAGGITAIIGPNGCGKSTLMRTLGGLLPIQAGEVRLDGRLVAQWSRKSLARQLALLPQAPVAPEGMSMRRVIEHGRFAHQGFFASASREDHAVVDWAIDQVGLGEFTDRSFGQLSGGERQRAWIALALAQKPKWLLLDEPTTYLDIGHQFEVLDLLARLNRDEGIGVVMVLHDINQASAYADRIVAMRDGGIEADGAPDAVVSRETVQKLFGIDVNVMAIGPEGRQRPHCIALPAHMAVR
ncbi:MAG: ABC transporter ATP-binding protein [Candidatus Devosia phytovorans]|uniref:ABC transporter ATP-binding protein n=1 Tax=Candidatus Devosia phytovorans TaxID=3121372 RepID=A0AAJ5VTC7_9HYPH|nr:ABC transporter ATP-binding protein [Devosia sp.]WEK02989.1 MAG: ABC transporter ATP-binding protein [Devosia sp.]